MHAATMHYSQYQLVLLSVHPLAAPRYLWEFVALTDIHSNSLCDINLEVEKGTVIKGRQCCNKS